MLRLCKLEDALLIGDIRGTVGVWALKDDSDLRAELMLFIRMRRNVTRVSCQRCDISPQSQRSNISTARETERRERERRAGWQGRSGEKVFGVCVRACAVHARAKPRAS
jgi:hypothetical protein